MLNSRTESHYRALQAIPDHRATGETTALQRAASIKLVDYATEVVSELAHYGMPVTVVVDHASLVRACFERGDDATECARIVAGRANVA